MSFFCRVISLYFLYSIRIELVQTSNTVCPDGYYGTKCLLKCSTCNDVKCDLNGVCINGCRDGFTDDKCTTVKIIRNPATSITLNKKIEFQIGVGVVIAGVVISLILFLIAECRQRRGRNTSQAFEIEDVMSIKSLRGRRRATGSYVGAKARRSTKGKERKGMHEEGKQGSSGEYEWLEGGQGWWERWWRGEESFGDEEEEELEGEGNFRTRGMSLDY